MNPSLVDTLFAFGINHKTAPVEIRERLHLTDEEQREFLGLLRQEVSEAMVISTCNRTEVYCVSSDQNIDIERLKHLLIDFKGVSGIVGGDDFFSLISCTATHQLFRVATSIDSQVIGDSQILRQVKQAYQLAQECRMTGKILHQLLQRAFKLGKSTYTQTSIHEGAASISLAAVELAAAKLGSLAERTVLIIGAGEMAAATAEALAKRGVGRLIIANRTIERAAELKTELLRLAQVDCDVVHLGELNSVLNMADCIISSTGAEGLVLTRDDLSQTNRRMLAIDIAVPRDIDIEAGMLDHVTLKNIDDLRSILDEHETRRALDLPKIREMILSEMVDFLIWYYAQPLLPESRRGIKPTVEEKAEILKVKVFIDSNLNEIHKFAAWSGGDFAGDLTAHFLLIESLRKQKEKAFAGASL